MLAGKGVSGRVRLMFWASLHGAASEQMPPPTRTMTWHGMLYVMVYSMVYSMLYGMVLKSIRTDTITCNAAVSACEKGGEWPRTLDVLGVIARSRIRTDAASYQSYDMAWHALCHGI